MSDVDEMTFEYDLDQMDDDFTDVECSYPEPEVILELLPRKSRNVYEKKYEELMSWCSAKGVSKVSENVLLTYFFEKAKVLKSPSLWCIYAMLKSTLKVKNGIDIKVYHKLTAFLKKESVGYKRKNSKTFSQNEVYQFLREAPDNVFLMKKVVLIFGIAGACHRDELVQMKTENIEDKDSVIIVKTPGSKTTKSRTFTITNSDRIDCLTLCRKYFKLRPQKTSSSRLFLKYSKGICTNQAVGMNTIGKIPKDIAEYLGLPEPTEYTGRCFRRTSMLLNLVNGGEDIRQQKFYGGRNTIILEDDYIEDSEQNKNVICVTKRILESQLPKAAPETQKDEVIVQPEKNEPDPNPATPAQPPTPAPASERKALEGLAELTPLIVESLCFDASQVSEPELRSHNSKLQNLLRKVIELLKERSGLCANLEKQNTALMLQSNSLKDVVSITKDLLTIRNMEVEHLHVDIKSMEEKINIERERHNNMLNRMNEAVKLNDSLKTEYQSQLELFTNLRARYEEKVALLESENKRLVQLAYGKATNQQPAETTGEGDVQLSLESIPPP